MRFPNTPLTVPILILENKQNEKITAFIVI